jgi:predicted MPP superfamily phosphohydrolase
MRVYILAFIIIIAFTLAVDLSLWLFTKSFRHPLKKRLNLLMSLLYWLIPISFISSFFYLSTVINSDSISHVSYYRFTLLNAIYILFYIPKLIVVLFFSISHLSIGLKQLSVRTKTNATITSKGEKITRAQFLGKMSLMVGALPFAGIMYNITNGRFKFSINKNKITIKKLPQGLEGLRIVQLSDIHLGNFNLKYSLLEGVIEHINQLNADLIFITGDLVNNFASEAKGWDKVFSRLHAIYGKYAILGNHDYGDYSEWKSKESKQINFEKIKTAYANFGFKLLLNANETLLINGEELSLIGVENWGHPPFPRYGDLEKAMQGPLADFKILLTHDPDHWEAEILRHTDIDLSLSGHTHGMQVGVKFKNREWSPAKWKYKYWGGLYKKDDQYLYVNRGLGFVGVPLRIGMPPEITLLTLGSHS